MPSEGVWDPDHLTEALDPGVLISLRMKQRATQEQTSMLQIIDETEIT